MPTDPELLRKYLKVAKSRELNFAFGLAKDIEDCVLVLDLKREGKRLFAEIRKEHPDIKKGTWGTTRPNGNAPPQLCCERPLRVLEKLLPKVLKFHRITVKVEVLAPGEEEEEE